MLLLLLPVHGPRRDAAGVYRLPLLLQVVLEVRLGGDGSAGAWGGGEALVALRAGRFGDAGGVRGDCPRTGGLRGGRDCDW